MSTAGLQLISKALDALQHCFSSLVASMCALCTVQACICLNEVFEGQAPMYV